MLYAKWLLKVITVSCVRNLSVEKIFYSESELNLNLNSVLWTKLLISLNKYARNNWVGDHVYVQSNLH